MAYATGEVSISVVGSSFDSATYPRFVLGDGTNSLTFVIDNNARGLMDTEGSDAKSGDYTGGDATYPLEDSQKGRLVVPTFDEADGAKKALLAFEMTDQSNFNAWAVNSSLNDGAGLAAITTIPHFIFTDASGTAMKVGFGTGTGSNITSDGTWSLVAKYGSISSRYWLYKKASVAEYWIRVIDSSGNDWRLHTALMQAVNHAEAAGLINIEAYGATVSGTLQQPSSIANDTYTAAESNWVIFMATTAGFAGNACSMKFVDGTVSTGLSTDARKKSFKWGYDEYLASDSNINYVSHHSTSPTADQFWGKNFNTPIYFRQGTMAGSGTDASLSSANIAEAIKDMINGSILGITATRSSSTVSLTNDASGTGGNVTITTTNSSALFTVSGMAISEEEETTDMRTTISAKQLALSSSGGIAAYTGSSDQPSLKMDISALAALGASPATGDYIALHDVTTANSVKKITVAELIGSVAAGSDTHVQFNDGGSSLGGDAGLTYNKTTDALTIVGAVTAASADINGAADISGAASLAATGVLTNIRGTLSVDEAAVFDTTLGVTGISTFTGAIDANSTSDFQGAMNLQAGLTVAGALDLNAAADISGATSLAATGVLTDIRGTLSVDEAAQFDTTLGVTGASTLAAASFSGAIDANSTSDFQGAMNLQAGLTVAGAVDINAGADISGTVALGASGGSADTTVRGDLTVGENLTVTGDLLVQGDSIKVQGATVQHEDSIMEMNLIGGSAPGSATALDIGIKGHRHDGSTASTVALYWDESADEWVIDQKATESSGVMTSVTRGKLHSGEIDCDGAFDASGAANLQSTLGVSGASTLAAASFSGAIDANSTSDFQGAMNLQAGITVAGAVDINAAADISGATSLAATGVLTDVRGTLSVDEAAQFDTTLGVTGISTFTGAIDANSTSDFQGAMNLQAGLTVAGAVDVNAAADISGATSLAATGVLTDIRGTLSVDEAAQFDTTLGVTGASTLAAASFSGAIDANSTSDFQGAMNLQAGLTVAGAVDVNAAADISGATSLAATGVLTDIRGTLSVDEAAQFDTTLGVTGASTLAAASFSGAIDANSTSDFQGAMNLQAGLTVAGAVDVNAAADISGATSLAATGVLTDIRGTLSVDEAATFDAAVTFSGLADLTNSSVASGDKFVIQDADASGVAKEITFDHVAEKMAGAGIANTSGILSIVSVQDTYISGGGVTGFSGQKFTLSQSPASADALSVYVNGILQARSGSSGGFQGERDFNVSGTALTLVSANVLAAGDELVVKYIQD